MPSHSHNPAASNPGRWRRFLVEKDRTDAPVGNGVLPRPRDEQPSSDLRSIAAPALLSCALLWVAFPPMGLSWLAWCAPLGWLWIVDREAAPRRAGYVWLWLAGCLFWLAILQGIRLAFWPLIFGWIALSMYLAVYLPLFIGVARILRHRWRWSLCWAAPVAWTGMELIRSYMLTGYAANTLAHTQYRNPTVIQLADQLGGYAVGFVMVAVCALLLRLSQHWLARASARTDAVASNASLTATATATSMRASKWDIMMPASLLAVLLGYGVWRLGEGDRLAADQAPLLRVALIQENTPSMFDANTERLQKAWTRYAATTAEAVREQGAVDLIVWPESTFTAMVPWMEDHTVSGLPAEMQRRQYDRDSLRDLVRTYQGEFSAKTHILLDMIRGALGGQVPSSFSAEPVMSPGSGASHAANNRLPHLLVGSDVIAFEDEKVGRYNAALLLDPQGQIVSRYEKIHLVMFGEYIPLEWALAFLGEAFGFSSATPGTNAQSFMVQGVRISPSICFESMLPHLIAWQLRTLVGREETPDVLINITNDSWFHGSSILDHHLACDVLSAVEMRRPFLIAANTGLSAWIEGSGRIKHVSPRMAPYYIIAECTRDSRFGMTQVWGDLPGWITASICVLALVSYRRRRVRQLS